MSTIPKEVAFFLDEGEGIVKLLHDAAQENDLDKAAGMVQDYLGQTDGTNAGYFFHDAFAGDEPFSGWFDSTYSERRLLLIGYIMFEQEHMQ